MKRTRLHSGLLAALALAGCGGSGGGGAGGSSPPTVPDAGLYLSTQYALTDLTTSRDIAYSTRPNEGGIQYTSGNNKANEIGTPTLTLTLDVALPPNATPTSPQPLIVGIHGGGYTAGNKEDLNDILMTYAQAGYVVASINYRLTPDNQATPELRVKAIKQANEDAMNAIRFLKANAAIYHIDTSRIATLGTSAGGGIALVNSVEFDTLVDSVSDYGGTSSRVAAAISTGATLIEAGYDSDTFLHYDATDTPSLLFHANPTDSVTGATWNGNVVPTQTRINVSGNSCTTVAQPDMTHTVSLALGGKYWPYLKSFLWDKLRLASI